MQLFRYLLSIGIVIFCKIICHGQSVTNIPPAIQQLIDHKKGKGIELVLSDHHCDDKINLCYYYWQQQYEGIPIHGMISTITLAVNEQIIESKRMAQFKINPSSSPLKNNDVDDRKILKIALSHFNISNDITLLKSDKSNKTTRYYSLKSVTDEIISMDEVYVYENGLITLTTQVTMYVAELNQWWQLRIDPITEKVIDKNSWTIECRYDQIYHSGTSTISMHHKSHANDANMMIMADSSYLVYGFPLTNPDEGDRTEITRPWALNQSIQPSPFGWHDTDGQPGAEHTITNGNNVYAYPDRDADNAPDLVGIPDGGPGLSFHPPLTLSDEPQVYKEAATVNLFYWNNLVHDIMYNYGFNEGSGNFQRNNYGRGGIGNDFVRAEAQDGSGTDNANFSTLPDGLSPRMQMFEWTLSSNIPFIINGNLSYQPRQASFGPELYALSANLILADPIEACDPITNGSAISGNVAMIDRGNCKFVHKVLRAQNAGAIAAVICNTTEGTIAMGGDTSAVISIPAVMLSKSDCDEIKILLGQGAVQIEIGAPSSMANRDSDLDNGVIIHEYAHGISTRLTGGPSDVSCLSNSEQMGEGWSDYFALMLTMKSEDQGNDKKGMATYLEGQGIDGNGIRNYPYSTDMTANPFTYEDISSVSVPHGVGSVWATMLWDMTWGLIEKYGFDGDIYNGSGGNNIAIQLVTTALKMQPCNPGFIDGRDAILAADLAIYNGANQCIIWEAFAKRGLGFGADQGLSTSVTDGISNFDLPPSCNEKLIVEKTNNREFAGIGDTVHYIISVINNQPTQVQSLVMLDTIPPHLSYISNSLTQGVIDNNVISFTQTTSDSGSIYTIEYDCKINEVIGVQTEQIETFESAVTWQSIPIIGNEVWQSTNTSSHTGSNSMLAINSNSTQIQQLSKNIFLPKNAILSFWHSYETEEKWDGGLVELSLDNGSTWIDLSSYFIMNGYPKSINNVTNVPNAGKKAFTGNSEGYHLSVIDLSSFSHKDAIIRFLFGSDSSVGSIGWHIDDIYIYQSSIIENKAQVSATNAPIDSALSYSFVLPNCLECIAEYNCDENIFDLSNFDSHSYRANQNITTLGELQNGSPLVLRAGQSIEFKPSFSVPLNSILITEIENCSNDQ